MLDLKAIRIKHNKTQQELADYLRIARTTYTNIENHRSDPDTATIEALANYYNCPIDALFGRNSSEHAQLFACYDSLNVEGKKRVMEFCELLSLKDEYKQKSIAEEAI